VSLSTLRRPNQAPSPSPPPPPPPLTGTSSELISVPSRPPPPLYTPSQPPPSLSSCRCLIWGLGTRRVCWVIGGRGRRGRGGGALCISLLV
jgi:hypothetical protein